MTTHRYFYHSFPRPTKDRIVEQHGLRILELMIRHGFLLTPEAVSFRENHPGAMESRMCQVRMCFTELAPRELPEHAMHFGPFALEFEIDTLRSMGALPVFYLPTADADGDFRAVSLALVGRLGELVNLVRRLGDIDTYLEGLPGPAPINLGLNEQTIGVDAAGVVGIRQLLSVLKSDSQPFSQLLAMLGALGALFYPADDMRHSELLAYYRQREWRLLADFVRMGVPAAALATESQQRELIAHDAAFFGKPVEFEINQPPTPRAARCWFYKELAGSHVLGLARRILVPRGTEAQAVRLLAALRAPPEVVVMG